MNCLATFWWITWILSRDARKFVPSIVRKLLSKLIMDHVFQLVKIFFPLLHPSTLYPLRILSPRDSNIQAKKFVMEHDYERISRLSKKIELLNLLFILQLVFSPERFRIKPAELNRRNCEWTVNHEYVLSNFAIEFNERKFLSLAKPFDLLPIYSNFECFDGPLSRLCIVNVRELYYRW